VPREKQLKQRHKERQDLKAHGMNGTTTTTHTMRMNPLHSGGSAVLTCLGSLLAAGLCCAENTAPLGGPSSVHGQLHRDQQAAAQAPDAAVSLKDRLKNEWGLELGFDYTFMAEWASSSPADEDAQAGAARLYGTWTPFKRGEDDAGKLVFKGENRHVIGGGLTPIELGPAAGFAGLTNLTFNDNDFILTNFYWTQAFCDNRFAFNLGLVDFTDYYDIYGIANPWTDFQNIYFGNGPTVPPLNQGLGAVARFMFTPNWYVIGGFADSNYNQRDVAGLFDSFGEGEYIKHIEFGWIESWDKRYTDNIHVSAWQADERTKAGTPDGWGMSFSACRQFCEGWTGFVRAAWSDGGGSVFNERAAAAGVGYLINERNDYVGFAAAWGRVSDWLTSGQDEDQYTMELFYRYNPVAHLQLIAGMQFVLNPALTDTSSIWFPSVRARVSF